MSLSRSVSKRSCSTVSDGALSPAKEKSLWRAIEQDASKELNQVTFKQLYNYTKLQSNQLRNDGANSSQDAAQTQARTNVNNRTVLVESAEFLRQQLAPRIAKIIKTIDNLPYGVVDTPSFKNVSNAYLNTYRIVKTMPQLKVEWSQFVCVFFLIFLMLRARIQELAVFVLFFFFFFDILCYFIICCVDYC